MAVAKNSPSIEPSVCIEDGLLSRGEDGVEGSIRRVLDIQDFAGLCTNFRANRSDRRFLVRFNRCIERGVLGPESGFQRSERRRSVGKYRRRFRHLGPSEGEELRQPCYLIRYVRRRISIDGRGHPTEGRLRHYGCGDQSSEEYKSISYFHNVFVRFLVVLMSFSAKQGVGTVTESSQFGKRLY